jgi:hypothetical protein
MVAKAKTKVAAKVKVKKEIDKADLCNEDNDIKSFLNIGDDGAYILTRTREPSAYKMYKGNITISYGDALLKIHDGNNTVTFWVDDPIVSSGQLDTLIDELVWFRNCMDTLIVNKKHLEKKYGVKPSTEE